MAVGCIMILNMKSMCMKPGFFSSVNVKLAETTCNRTIISVNVTAMYVTGYDVFHHTECVPLSRRSTEDCRECWGNSVIQEKTKG